MPSTRTVYVNPPGRYFYDAGLCRELLLIEDLASGWNGWLCYRHPDGQWVTLRKATEDDLAKIEALHE